MMQWMKSLWEDFGYCTVHHQYISGTCDLCEDIDWACIECEEVRYGDSRVEAGLKCIGCTDV